MYSFYKKFNKKQILLFLATAFLIALTGIVDASAQDHSPVKWTIVDSPNQPPVSTVPDSSAPAPGASSSQAKNAKKEKPAQENRSAEIVKALSGTQENDMSKTPEVTRESIDLIFAPYRKQKKEEFLSKQDHDLKDVIERAQNVQTQAKAAQEGISLAQRRMLLALRQMFPEMNFEYNHRDGSLSAAEYISRGERVSFRQPLFRGGVLWNGFLQERKMLEAARSNYNKVIDDLVFEVSKVYFEYQRARAVEEDQRQALEIVKPQIEISEKKFAEKLTSEIEHLNVQSLAGQIEFDHETSKQEFEIAKLDLQHYLALGMDDPLNLKKEYDVDKVIASMPPDDLTTAKVETALGSFNHGNPIPGLESLIEKCYGHRAELSVQVSQLEAARYGERVRWGGFVPKADLLVEFGSLGEVFSQFANQFQHKGEFRLMLEVNWNAAGNKVGYTYENDRRAPSVTQFESGAGTILHRNTLTAGLLNGLDTFVDVKQAEVEKLNKVVELEQTEKKVLEEVKRAYYDYQKALIQMKSAMKRVQWRQRLRDLAQHRLETKEVEISEYIQSEIDLLKERSEFHGALKDYYTAKANLNYAVGTQEFFAWQQSGKTGK